MAFIHTETRELNFKFAFYGPSFSGKTTNVHYIYKRTQSTQPEATSKMISEARETEHIVHFDFQPQGLGKIRGFDCRFHLYTFAGAAFSNSARLSVLRGVDAIIFVADSQAARAQANVESLENLESNLTAQVTSLAEVPMVLQYNKRDLPEVLPVADLDAMLNKSGRPRFEGIARTGVGVYDALKEATRLMLEKARRTWG